VNLEDQIAELKARIAKVSRDGRDFRQLGLHLQMSGRLDEALRIYETALGLELPIWEAALIRIDAGWARYHQGDHLGAAESARRALDDLSREAMDEPHILYAQGGALSLLAHSLWRSALPSAKSAARDAVVKLERIIENYPDFEEVPAAHAEAARLFLLLCDAKRALIHARRTLDAATQPHLRVSAIVDCADAFRLSRRWLEAERILLEGIALTLQPSSGALLYLPRLQFLLGTVQHAQGRRDQAKEAFNQSLQSALRHPFLQGDPDFLAQVHTSLGHVWAELGELDPAIEAFNRVLELHPNDDNERRYALLWLGYCHGQRGEIAQARDSYEQVLQSQLATSDELERARAALDGLRQGAQESSSWRKWFTRRL
jgi:tetratricopeptide (TPR) repeat protein